MKMSSRYHRLLIYDVKRTTKIDGMGLFNKVKCAILLVTSKFVGWDSLHYLAFGPTVQILSTPWADSTVVTCAKVNCQPSLKVHLSLGSGARFTKVSVLRCSYDVSYQI